MKNLTLKQKILQMFIMGFQGVNFNSNELYLNLVKNGLGGTIFFTSNIDSKEQFKNLIKDLKEYSYIPMFYSIDQEGGRVERTEKIHNGKKYKSAMFAYQNGIVFLKNQTSEIADELNYYGINMNFAPVLDVNTNKDNPIIGERAFSNKTSEVIEASSIVIKEYESKKIIPVGKHFPGHGDANCDSHKSLPVIDLSYDDLYINHIKPFEIAINNNIPAIMVAHVIYPAIEQDNIPASLSKKVITDLLINKLNFKGLILTDDMEMNAVKGFTRLEACIKAINAGVSMFIFRDTTEEIIQLTDYIEKAVLNGQIDENQINNAVEKIFKIKYQYGIIQ